MGREFNNQCRLCGTTENLSYCSLCGHWFCPECEKNYPERVKAFKQEKIVDPIKKWVNGLFQKSS